MAPAAGNAALRPAQKRSRWASSRETSVCTAPLRLHHFLDAPDLVGHFLARAVGLAEQDCRDVCAVACPREILHRAGGGLVHHFEAGGNDAGGDDVCHRLAGLLDVIERSHHDLGVFRLRQQLDRHLESITPSRPSDPVISASRS